MDLQVLRNQIDTLGKKGPPSSKEFVPAGVKFKVALVGPRQGGKSRISAQLAGKPVAPDDYYEPTAGVRILEFEEKVTARSKDGRTANAVCQVELWDLSGDNTEQLWPAVVKDLMGVMVVFDPTSKQQANDVRIWCEWFCKSSHLDTGQCVIFAHGALTSRHKPLSVKGGLGGVERTVSVPIVNVNFNLSEERDGQVVDIPSKAKAEFIKFLAGLYPLHPDATYS